MSSSNRKWLIVFLFVFLFAVSEKAQTRDALQKKYKSSSTIETFDVRTGIVAIVFYDQNGNVDYIVLQPPMILGEYQIRKMEMPEKIVNEVIEELNTQQQKRQNDRGYGNDFVWKTIYPHDQLRKCHD